MNGREVKSYDGVLVFESLKESDHGEYECVVQNENGFDTRRAHIDLSRRVEQPTTVKSNSSIRIQVLSDPATDHVENGLVKLQCISGIDKALYEWSLINKTFSPNVRITGNVLILEPFLKENVGVYRCLAFSAHTGEHVSRRISINIEAAGERELSKPPVLDISSKLQVRVVSGPEQNRRGGSVVLRCDAASDSPPDIGGLVWSKRGSKFSPRAFTLSPAAAHNSSLTATILEIRNFKLLMNLP